MLPETLLWSLLTRRLKVDSRAFQDNSKVKANISNQDINHNKQ